MSECIKKIVTRRWVTMVTIFFPTLQGIRKKKKKPPARPLRRHPTGRRSTNPRESSPGPIRALRARARHRPLPFPEDPAGGDLYPRPRNLPGMRRGRRWPAERPARGGGRGHAHAACRRSGGPASETPGRGGRAEAAARVRTRVHVGPAGARTQPLGGGRTEERPGSWLSAAGVGHQWIPWRLEPAEETSTSSPPPPPPRGGGSNGAGNSLKS
jgi:hypothetical protein